MVTVFEEKSSRPLFLAANHAMFTLLTDRRDFAWPSHLHNVISWAFEGWYHAQYVGAPSAHRSWDLVSRYTKKLKCADYGGYPKFIVCTPTKEAERRACKLQRLLEENRE